MRYQWINEYLISMKGVSRSQAHHLEAGAIGRRFFKAAIRGHSAGLLYE